MVTLLLWSHVGVSLVAIAAGIPLLAGFISRRSSRRTTTFFLVTTTFTSVSGFPLPATHFLPSHAVGIVSLLVLALVFYARSRQPTHAGWQKVFVVGCVVALYLNVFVAVVQSFLKIPALKAMAPTQTETPFKLTQLAVLVLFIALGVVAVSRSRPAATAAGSKLPIPS